MKSPLQSIVVFSLSFLLAIEVAVAGPLLPGDILVADRNAFSGDGGVIRVDPTTGVQTMVSSGGLFINPLNLAITTRGSIFVTDSTGDATTSVGIVRVNPLTGSQTLVVPAGGSFFPLGITTDAADNVFVSFYGGGFAGRVGGIIRLDSTTGAQTVISPAGSFAFPFGIAIDPGGNLIVVDNDFFAGIHRFVRVDPTTGTQTTFSSAGFTINPGAVAVDPNGNVFVTLEAGFGSPDGAVIRVDPTTGAQTVVSSGGFLVDPLGIAIDAAGNLLVTDVNTDVGPGRIIRIDPVTGAQSLVSGGGSLIDPIGIVVVPQGQVVPVLTVAIDIIPGSFPNSINPRGEGKIPVAILTTDGFDATTVDPTTVLFGRTGTEAAPVHSALEDVDGDRDTDMILHFKTQETGIQCGDTSGSLTGKTFGGQMIEGSDSMKTVGCK
jgi:sugar lactone lactonase YvrE